MLKSLEEISKIDFNSPEMKAEIEAIEKRNKELLENMKVDRKSLSMTFDF